MAGIPDIKQSTDFDDKDDKSSRSIPDDEENALPSGDKREDQQSQTKNDENSEPQPEVKDVDEVPNGGLQAWLQVLGSFMLFFNTFGILNTFGVYQTYYESGQLWTTTSSNISWIGSIQSFMVLLTGSISGPVFDRGYLTTLIIIGTLLITFGHMMLSLCHTFWQCLLAQGFAIGLGAGCLYIPSIAIMPQYFSSRIGLAIGLAASGSSMGGIIYPIMFYKLIDQVGFPWSVRILGFTAFATLILPIMIMKLRKKPGKVRSVIDWTAFTDLPFIFFTLGCVIGFIGLYTGIFYTSYYAQAQRITNDSLAFYLVPILNAGSVFGRTLPNWLSDRVGPLNVICPGVIVTGIVLLCYLAVDNVAGMIVCTLLFGFFSGIFIALPPVLFAAFTADKTKIGTRLGMGFTMIGAGVLCGGPGAGGVLGTDAKHLNWVGTWIYGGVASILAGAIFCTLRITRGGSKLKVKI